MNTSNESNDKAATAIVNDFNGAARAPGYASYLVETCQSNPQIFIELSSICNFRCFYCASSEHNRKSQIDDETFFRVLDQAATLTKQPIRFHCDGEPTIHRNFYKYALAVNERGMSIDLVTNGSNLQKRFLDLKMNVSIHLSASKEEFRERSALDFEKYLDGLSNYLRWWLDSSAEQTISYNLYLTGEQRRSPEEMARLIEFANGFVEKCGISVRVPRDAKPNSQWMRYARAGSSAKFFLNARNIASGGMYPDTEGNIPKESGDRNHGFCDSPWKRLVVLADGSLQPCCLDLKGTLAYTQKGAVNTAPLSDLWNNDEVILRIRQEMLDGTVKHPTCQLCLDRMPNREFYVPFVDPFREA